MMPNYNACRTMRLIPILLLLASSVFASSRPLIDDQRLIALDARAGGFDAYWIRRNELAPVVTTRLLRTPISLDGKIAGSTVLIREEDGLTALGVGVGPAGPLVFRASGFERTLYVNDKLIARYVDQASLLCGATLCAALWYAQNSFHAQYLDRDGNPVGAPFALPAAWYLYAKTMVEDDLVVVRAFDTQVRATRIGFGGAIRYDAMLLAREPLSNEHPVVADSHDPARSVFAVVESPWTPLPVPPSQNVRAVAIDANGVVEQLGAMSDVIGNNALGPVALVWDGSQHRLITRSRFGIPTAAAANDGAIAIGWTGFRPSVSVFANGVMTAPVELEDVVRRRTVGR